MARNQVKKKVPDTFCVSVISVFALAQNGVANQVVGMPPVQVAAAVGDIGFQQPAGAVVDVFGDHAAGVGRLEHPAFLVIPGAGDQRAHSLRQESLGEKEVQ